MTNQITEYLAEEWNFKKVFQSGNPELIDINRFTCALRIHILHYLYWSETHKHFSLVLIHERPKGKSGGGTDYATEVMIPKVINTIDDAKLLLEGVVNKEMLHLYL